MPCNKLTKCQASNCGGGGRPQVFANNYMFSMTPSSAFVCPNPAGGTWQDFTFTAGTYILSNALSSTHNQFYLATNSFTACPGLLESLGSIVAGGQTLYTYHLYTIYMHLNLISCDAPGAIIDQLVYNPLNFRGFNSFPGACLCTGWNAVLNIKIVKYNFQSINSSININNIISQCNSLGATLCPIPNGIVSPICPFHGEGILGGLEVRYSDIAELAYVLSSYVKYDPTSPMILRKACFRDRHNFPNFITVTPL